MQGNLRNVGIMTYTHGTIWLKGVFLPGKDMNLMASFGKAMTDSL
jgi:hypothetical protein